MNIQRMWQGWIGRPASRHHTTRGRQLSSRRLILEPLEDRTLLSVYTVDRLTDTGAGDGLTGDLRYCITQATSGEDTITFAVTGTIELNQALPTLATSVAIDGPGASELTIDARQKARVFAISDGVAVEISGLEMIHGAVIGYGVVPGGGINNHGTLTLNGVIVSQNEDLGYYSNGRGGGIANFGVMTINSSTIANNNVAEPMFESISHAYGAGIDNEGTLTISDSTIAGNTASAVDSHGGGIDNVQGTLTIANSTIAGNSTLGTGKGGGIWSANIPLSVHDTIVATNTSGSSSPDLSGNLTTSGYNLFGTSSGGMGYAATDLLDVDPMLGPLQDNGGHTSTMALLDGSPAIDAGDDTDAPKYDQRGPAFPRIINGIIDMGAVEYNTGRPVNVGTAVLSHSAVSLPGDPLTVETSRIVRLQAPAEPGGRTDGLPRANAAFYFLTSLAPPAASDIEAFTWDPFQGR